MKKRTLIGLFLLLILILTGIYFIGVRNGRDNGNQPYEPDTPAPDPHNGVFVSEHGTLTFNGDGKTIDFDFDDDLSGWAGISKGSGTYVFLSGDLPPHGSVDVRYDVAHEFEISSGEDRVVIDLGIASEDGKTAQVGVGTVTEERIPFLFRVDGKSFTVFFEKK